jgi:hypothetical protein
MIELIIKTLVNCEAVARVIFLIDRGSLSAISKKGRNKAKRCFFLRIPSSINERSELMRLRLLPITNTGMKRPVLRLRQADLYLWLSAAFC